METKGKRRYVSLAEQRDTPLTIEQARAMLPNVGDRMRKVPVSPSDKMQKAVLAWCTVIYVNATHLWYTVQFQGAGTRFRGSYKVPEQTGGYEDETQNICETIDGARRFSE